MEAISKLATGMGGFVVTSNLYKTTTNSGIEVPVANITIRVPVAQLDAALNQIKAMVEDKDVDILSEDVSGQDVTSEVTDLESRLRNLQAAETQLLEIMDNATKTEDVITVFRELTTVRGEIEVIQGQIKYYRESASLSAINVNLQAKAAVEPITIAGWQPGVEVQKALQALVNGGKYLSQCPHLAGHLRAALPGGHFPADLLYRQSDSKTQTGKENKRTKERSLKNAAPPKI